MTREELEDLISRAKWRVARIEAYIEGKLWITIDPDEYERLLNLKTVSQIEVEMWERDLAELAPIREIINANDPRFWMTPKQRKAHELYDQLLQREQQKNT